MHGPLQAQRTRTLAGLAQSGVWILVGLVPIIFLLRLFALTLYSVPESDDFCFSYMNRDNGFAETIWIFYHSLVGRILPLAAIQLPATISGATGFDYFICYVVTLAGLEISFAAAILVFAFRMWPRGSVLQNIAFGAAFAATMLGARLILPGPNVDPESVLGLMVSERVTIACGVPTVWIAVLEALEKNPGRWKFDNPIRVICGGTAPPLELIRRLDRFHLHIKHLWGMTETTPIGTSGGLRPHMRELPDEKKYEVRAKQGWPAPFVEIRLMRPEGSAGKSTEVPWDGVSSGEIEIRGPWVAASYHESPDQAHRWTADGWFRTGDVATMDDEGYVKIVDRAKDLVKSGGEWISSVDLENTLMGHPAVKEACVVGIPHPKWQERPLAAVVLKDGANATPKELRAFLAESFAKWQLPDAFVFLDTIPRTSVGKFKKIALREQFADWKWDS